MITTDSIANEMHGLANVLWPLNRSITGMGVEKTLELIKALHLPNLAIRKIASGTKVFDWTIPQEWHVRSAHITCPNGQVICDFNVNNLHLVGYSTSIDKVLPLSELQNFLHSLPDQPDAIPYVTSYYTRRWGFCISHNQRLSLEPGNYRVFIDSTHFSGNLTYGELLIQGQSKKEIFLSTYICHPSLANNELSGICVTTYVCKFIEQLKNRKYSYRIIFIPETIGSIAYLAENLAHLKNNVFAGFNITCVGDDRSFSYLPSRNGSSLSDLVAKHVLSHLDPNYVEYTWSDRGSDERQYCAPGIDLPIASIMRTKYGEYSEYHTSLDNLTDVVTPAGLYGGYLALRESITAIEMNCIPKCNILGEPNMGKRGLYPTLSEKKAHTSVRLMMTVLSWSDGSLSLLEIADKCRVPIWSIYEIIDTLLEHKLIEIVKVDN